MTTNRPTAATGPTVQQLANDVWLVEVSADLDAVLIADLDGTRQPIRGPYPANVAELALSAVESNFPTDPPTPGAKMCKAMTLSPAGSQREREIRIMQQAAKRPGVAEFARMVAEARRLAHQINQWCEANPICELTEANLGLRTALKDEVCDGDPMPDVHRAFASMGFVMEASIDLMTNVMLISVFPECFKKLPKVSGPADEQPDDDGDELVDEPTQPAKRSARKTVCNRIQPFTA